MTETYAATAAVVIPVLAFAMAVPIRNFGRRPYLFQTSKTTPVALITSWVVFTALIVLLILQVRAEAICLTFLRSHPDGLSNADGFVNGVILWSMSVMLILPGATLYLRGLTGVVEWLKGSLATVPWLSTTEWQEAQRERRAQRAEQ